MKFSGKELFELGIPKNKIKFFVGREFESVDSLLAELAPKENEYQKVFTWVDWIMQTYPVTWLPTAWNGDLPIPMSRGELKRLLDKKSIQINGRFPTSRDECTDAEFPIKDFIWFPKSKKQKTTWV